MSVGQNKVEYKLSSGGSGRGMSFYTSYMACPRKVVLDQLHEPAQVIRNDGAGVGTLYHAYLDLFHGDEVKLDKFNDVEFTGIDVEIEAQLEAWRLFSWYKNRFRPDVFGDVIYNERKFPETDKQAILMAETVGADKLSDSKASKDVPLFTGQFDLTTQVRAKHIDEWKRKKFISDFRGVEEGFYIVDHKSDRSFRKTIFDEYMYRLQFDAYKMIFEALFPNVYLAGLIASVIIKNKEPKYLFVNNEGGSSETGRKAVREFFNSVHYQMVHRPEQANPNNCFAWFKMCHHLKSGRCARF